MDEKKRCPYCGEEILAVAKKCRYCGEWLDKEPVKKEMITCPVCGEQIEEGTDICPYCHEKIARNVELRKGQNYGTMKINESKGKIGCSLCDNNKKEYIIFLVLIVCCIIVSGTIFYTIQQPKTEQKAAKSAKLVTKEKAKIKHEPYSGGEDVFIKIKKETERQVKNPFHDTDEVDADYQFITAVNSLNLTWPKSLRGVEDIKPLQAYLMRLIFKTGNLNLNEAVSKFLNYRPTENDLTGAFGYEQAITMSPHSETNKYVQFEIEFSGQLGGGTSASSYDEKNYVTFDKYQQRILPNNEILKNPESPDVLRMLNNVISKGDYQRLAEKIPKQIRIESRKLVFVFPKYEVGCGADGEVEIGLSYRQLSPYLTDEFKRLIE